MVAVLAWVAHYVSYHFIKVRTLNERKWDYNICCGTTDGGGINADIVRHAPLPRFERIEDVTRLSHPDGAFEHVLCSHTIEHVPDPAAMYRELRRIGRHVTLLVPPLWDFTAAFHPLEHQVIFLTLRSRHDDHLPRYVRYLPARWLQKQLGQRIEAEGNWQVRANRFRVLLDRLVPFGFAGTAVLCLAGRPSGLVVLIFSLVLLWLSKWTPSSESGRTQDNQLPL